MHDFIARTKLNLDLEKLPEATVLKSRFKEFHRDL
jgi:hypothetical protein